MLTNDFFIPARDPGSLDSYTDSLSINIRSIIASLRGATLEVGSSYVVHSNIPLGSIGEFLVWRQSVASPFSALRDAD